MTPREKLQYCYELAFFPPRLQALWYQVKAGTVPPSAELRELLDTALLLHQRLPESGYASQRALERLALYLARARAFGQVRFLRNVRQALGYEPLAAHEVPGRLVRDVGLPELCRRPSPPRLRPKRAPRPAASVARERLGNVPEK
jgi:hypothetical protein